MFGKRGPHFKTMSPCVHEPKVALCSYKAVLIRMFNNFYFVFKQ